MKAAECGLVLWSLSFQLHAVPDLWSYNLFLFIQCIIWMSSLSLVGTWLLTNRIFLFQIYIISINCILIDKRSFTIFLHKMHILRTSLQTAHRPLFGPDYHCCALNGWLLVFMNGAVSINAPTPGAGKANSSPVPAPRAPTGAVPRSGTGLEWSLRRPCQGDRRLAIVPSWCAALPRRLMKLQCERHIVFSARRGSGCGSRLLLSFNSSAERSLHVRCESLYK